MWYVFTELVTSVVVVVLDPSSCRDCLTVFFSFVWWSCCHFGRSWFGFESHEESVFTDLVTSLAVTVLDPSSCRGCVSVFFSFEWWTCCRFGWGDMFGRVLTGWMTSMWVCLGGVTDEHTVVLCHRLTTDTVW